MKNTESEKVNVLIWTSSFYPNLGGLQNATNEFASYLKHFQYNVQVLTNRYPIKLKEVELISGIQVNRYLFLSSPYLYLKRKRIDLFFGWFLIKPYTILKLLFFFLKFKPSIVNIHFPDNQIFECLFFQKIFKYKIISSFHGNELERMQKNRTWNFKNLLYHKLLIASDYITGCSNFILDGLKASFPKVEPEKLKPILNGVSDQLLNTPLNLNRKEYFFSASRFIPKKGIDLLFKILLKLTSEKLYLAGGCKQDIDLMSLKLTSNIEILGKQEFKSVINYLTNAKITLVTSKIEPYGIFVAEAISSGTPLITTNVGGIPEVIALATLNLTTEEKKLFYLWVKIVDPKVESFLSAIREINSNEESSYRDFLEVINKIRPNFSWNDRLKIYGEQVQELIKSKN